MNTKHSGKISGCLIVFIIFLIALAVGLSLSDNANDMVEDYYSGDAAKQISLEIKKDQPLVSHSAIYSGMTEKTIEELFFIVRVNHDIDMEMNFEIDVTKAEDGIEEALKFKVYDSTDEKVIYDDKLAQLDEKVYEELQLANASKKSDTRYEMTLYFDQEVGNRYENSAVEFDLKWYVSDDAAEELRDAKTGNVKWIFYSFFIGGALMLILFFFGRKYMNPEVFMTPEERGVDNGLDGVGNETVMPKEKKKKKK